MGKLNDSQKEKVYRDRELQVYKRNDMIQKARFTLTVQEQRAVLYAISKIKATDTYLTDYVFDIKDFYALCGIEDQSYTRLKQMLIALKSKCWWILLPDGETESAVSWFNKVRTNKKSGKVTIRFDEDMMPYLIQLATQNEYFTNYNLKYVLAMSCQYAPRLYELLKSYQVNNRKWFFEIDELKRLLDCKNYVDFHDFKRRALEPAVEEINKYTDLKIVYKTEKTGRKITKIWFGMAGKTASELLEADKAVVDELDGQISLFDLREENESDPLRQFFAEHQKKVREEREGNEQTWKKK